MNQTESNHASELRLPESDWHIVEDVMHQLKGPLNVASQYAQRLQDCTAQDPRAQVLVTSLQAVLKKARGAMLQLSVLGSNSGLSSKAFESISTMQLLQMVARSVSYNEVLSTGRDRGLTFCIDRTSFETAIPAHFAADADLLDQAIFNILDNACKYSYANSTIRVALRASGGKLKLEVVNKGLPLKAEEASLVTQRGWRGRNAMLVTGEGSGIGLWMADRIAKAQGGHIEVLPTDASGETRVTLVIQPT